MRVTGRFLGFCLAATLAPTAFCGVPAGSDPATHVPRFFNADSSAPTVGLQQALHPQGGRAGEPELQTRDCDQHAPHGLSADTRTAAELQTPMPKPIEGSDVGPATDAAHTPGDGVRRSMAARSAVLDTDKVSLGMAPAPASADDQTVNIKVRPLNDRERALFAVPEGGLIVISVGEGAAQQAGFRQGDVVLMLDGINLTSSDQFYQLIRQRPHNRPVPVLVRRPTSDLFLPLGSPRR